MRLQDYNDDRPLTRDDVKELVGGFITMLVGILVILAWVAVAGAAR